MTIEYKDSKRIVGLSQLAITHDTTSSTESSGSVSSLTHNMTVADNSNRVLIACVSSYGSAPTITGVTWNGDSMTAVPNSESYQSGSNNRTQLYYIIAPDTGSHSIVASFSGSATCGIGGMSFYNVHQTTPVGAGNTSSATSTATSSLALTPTVTGSWIIAMISSSSSLGSATGLTQSYTEGTNALLRGGRNESPTIGSANTVGWGTSNGSHAMSGCAIIPYGDEKPTNVQDNSLLVEKDTARRYWFDADASYTTVEEGATADSSGGAAYVTYKQITGLTAGDEISHVTFDVYSTPTDTSFKGGVYTDSSNNPTTLLASGELTNQNVSNTYTTLSIPLTSNATVPSDGKVWVAIIPNKTNPLLRVSTASSSYTNSKFSTTTGSYTNYSNWMLSTASVQGAGENNVRFGVKIYHAPVWTMQPTWSDDFSTIKGWVSANSTYSSVNTSTEKLDFDWDNSDGSSDKQMRYDLTSVATNWILRFKLNWSALTASSNAYMYVGLTDNVGGTSTSQSGFMLRFINAAPAGSQYVDFGVNQVNSTLPYNLGGNGVANMVYTTNKDFYVEMKKDGTTLTGTVFENSDYTGVWSTATQTITTTITPSLRYLHFWNSMSANTGAWTGTIDDVEIYNGVGSIN